MQLFSPAKINLFLAIQGKDASGYHLLDTVFLRTNLLQDEIELEPAEKLSITFLPSNGINPQNNTVLTALRLLEAKTQRHFTVRITIRKAIPLGSGLGGASSNAATLLLALNEQEQLGLSREELMELGAQVGMDVPFFLSGYEVAHGTHYGEQLSPLPALPQNIQLRILLSEESSLTKEAYVLWDAEYGSQPAKTSATFRDALQRQDAEAILKNLHNDFQVFFTPPQVAPHETALLTGSGSAFVAVSCQNNHLTKKAKGLFSLLCVK